jgi:hypothetical protein
VSSAVFAAGTAGAGHFLPGAAHEPGHPAPYVHAAPVLHRPDLQLVRVPFLQLALAGRRRSVELAATRCTVCDGSQHQIGVSRYWTDGSECRFAYQENLAHVLLFLGHTGAGRMQ